MIIFQNAGMRQVVANSAEWRALRAVQQHRAYVTPDMPYGWLDEPPSINRLLGVERLRVGAISEEDGKGRHTTTARQLVELPGGALLIDTPGMRELRLWDDEAALDATFDDIARFAESCRFRDCAHAGEPGCAVQNAGMDEGRLANYHKMQKELDYLERKTDKRLMSENNARWKAIHKAMRKDSKMRS